MTEQRTQQALELMTRFAERTGLDAGSAPRRYLWTDAFAVCNLIGLGRPALAVRLVDQVHRVLGRHRGDAAHTGWLSGLEDEVGVLHPTIGGLRIGKPLPERGRDEPMDEQLEWDRDGQYFHYLTMWIHALDQLARATGEARYHVWARELADVAHRRFTYGPLNRRRMHWKMSTDLSRPLVASMGHHDPLAGLVTCAQLEATSAAIGAAPHGPDLANAAAAFRAMLDLSSLATADPLGIGGLLVDACRLIQLRSHRALARRDEDLVEVLLVAAEVGLAHYVGAPDLRLPADRRLAFREFGLAIGLAATLRAGSAPADRLARFSHLATQIESFWLRPEHRRTRSWGEHADINDVMLATALAPDGFVVLHGLAGRR